MRLLRRLADISYGPFEAHRMNLESSKKMSRILSLIILGLICACASDNAQAPQPETTTASAPNNPISAATSDYVLGPGDRLKITVFGQQELSGEFLVSSGGTIDLPLIGETQASGRSASQFAIAVENGLRGDYLKDPNVNVQVVQFRPYYILGEVNRPGEYPFIDGLTVVKAIAVAGGYTYRANRSRVFIKKAMSAVENSVSGPETTMITPGDTVRVPERFF